MMSAFDGSYAVTAICAFEERARGHRLRRGTLGLASSCGWSARRPDVATDERGERSGDVRSRAVLHVVDVNPTLAFERHVELADHLQDAQVCALGRDDDERVGPLVRDDVPDRRLRGDRSDQRQARWPCSCRRARAVVAFVFVAAASAGKISSSRAASRRRSRNESAQSMSAFHCGAGRWPLPIGACGGSVSPCP